MNQHVRRCSTIQSGAKMGSEKVEPREGSLFGKRFERVIGRCGGKSAFGGWAPLQWATSVSALLSATISLGAGCSGGGDASTGGGKGGQGGQDSSSTSMSGPPTILAGDPTPTAGVCGDGMVGPSEECDDGNKANTDECLDSCRKATCGDGFLLVGVEECDDGNQEDNDACTSQCKAAVGCLNGLLDPGEECDDGNSSNTDDCLTSCKKAACSDGFLRIGVEECDDGNENDEDSCTNACKLGQTKSYACPDGVPLVVSLAADVTVTGDTTKGAAKQAGSCSAGGQAKEIVYAVTPSSTGVLVATVQGQKGFDPVLYARSGDCATGAELGCSDNTFSSGTESILFSVTAAKRYYVFIDGYTGTMGSYSLNLHLEQGVPGDICPGLSVALSPNNDVILNGSTAAAGAHYKGTGSCALSKGTNEIVYAVIPSQSGTMKVVLQPATGFDGELYVRNGSCTTGTQIACSEAKGPGGVESVTLPVTSGSTYSVFVDGKSGSSGAYTVTFHIDP